MRIKVPYKNSEYHCDLSKPLDISIPVGQVKCFYAPDWNKAPVKAGAFIGAVKAGAPVNFFDIALNPHGNGTHTESLGHITVKQESIQDCLQQFHFIAQLISIPLSRNDTKDSIIAAKSLKQKCPEDLPDALIIRTLPNTGEKRSKDYSGTNPPYLAKAAMKFIVEKKVKHLLLDLPSVDKEEDGGKMENHRIFWNVPSDKAKGHSRLNSTITELVYVPNEIEDGLYLLNIQVPSIDLDAAPSKPVLYQLEKN